MTLGWRSATLHRKPSRLSWIKVTTAAELGSNCLWTPPLTRVLTANAWWMLADGTQTVSPDV